MKRVLYNVGVSLHGVTLLLTEVPNIAIPVRGVMVRYFYRLRFQTLPFLSDVMVPYMPFSRCEPQVPILNITQLLHFERWRKALPATVSVEMIFCFWAGIKVST